MSYIVLPKKMGEYHEKIVIFTVSMGAGEAERVVSLLLPLLIKDYEVTLFLSVIGNT